MQVTYSTHTETKTTFIFQVVQHKPAT